VRRILGVDPGSRITGFGIIEVNQGRFQYVTSGCIRTQEQHFPLRLKVIFEELGEVIRAHQPDVMAIEQVFVKTNVSSALKLGQARGAAICAGVMQGLDVGEYAPTEIKQAVVGSGRASKAQVQHMVSALLKLSGLPQEDAADGLAIALCHAQRTQHQQRMNMGLTR
jgi:crossover junction endodeoxyribonuclease RuvC